MIYQRLLTSSLTRNRPFCLLGAAGVGKTTLISEFAKQFSNCIHLDLETSDDRSIFSEGAPWDETLRAMSFLKDKELRGKGTLIVLDEIGRCPGAIEWASGHSDKWTGGQADKRTSGQADKRTGGQADKRTGGQADRQSSGQADRRTGGQADRRTSGPADGWAGGNPEGPFIVATSSVLTKDVIQLLNQPGRKLDTHYVFPFSFEEFLMAMADNAALEAFREVPVPYYSYDKLLNYFHLYSLIGGMPEITAEYAATRHLAPLKKLYGKIEDRFSAYLAEVTASKKSHALTMEVLQNTYPFAATRISFKRFGNIEKGSREISQAFTSLESAFIMQLIYPVASPTLPFIPDTRRFPRLQMLDTGLVNYFSGIQKPLFQSHDMNAIFEGQIARQVVGQEMIATTIRESLQTAGLHFWIRNKAQSTAEVDFVIPFNDLLIPVVVKPGEPGRLRSLHQFIDQAPHAYAVRLYAGKLAVQQTQTIRGKKFYLMNLPYFLAGKIKDHLKGFIRLTEGT